MVIADVDWTRFVPVFCSARRRPLLESVPEAAAVLRTATVDTGTVSALRERLGALPETGRRRAVTDLVREHAAAVLGHDSPNALPADRAFRDVGFDSITAVELRNRLRSATGLSLPATLVFDHPSPAALADQLLALAFDTGTADTAAPAAPTTAEDDDPIAIVGLGCRYAGGVSSPGRAVATGRGRPGRGRRPAHRPRLGPRHPVRRRPRRPGPQPRPPGRLPRRPGRLRRRLLRYRPGRGPGHRPAAAAAAGRPPGEAFEHAGIDPTALRGGRVGVFAGANVGDYASSRGPGAGGPTDSCSPATCRA